VSSIVAAESCDAINLTAGPNASNGSPAFTTGKRTYRDMLATNDAENSCVTDTSSATELNVQLIPTLTQWNNEQKGCAKAYSAGLIEQLGTATTKVNSIPISIDVLSYNPGHVIDQHGNVFPVQEMFSRAVNTMQQLLKRSVVNDKPHFVILPEARLAYFDEQQLMMQGYTLIVLQPTSARRK
jgi:hypothetical protein